MSFNAIFVPMPHPAKLRLKNPVNVFQVIDLKLNRVEWPVLTYLVLWAEAGIEPTTFGL